MIIHCDWLFIKKQSEICNNGGANPAIVDFNLHTFQFNVWVIFGFYVADFHLGCYVGLDSNLVVLLAAPAFAQADVQGNNGNNSKQKRRMDARYPRQGRD